MSANLLPEDINRDILLRLPAKSLVACKFLCKSWFSIISDHDFVKVHLDRTTKTNNCSLMLQSYGGSIYSVSYDSLLSSSNKSDGDVALKPDSHYKPSECIELFGSCNGLLYFWSYKMDIFALCNPTTKEWKRLPSSRQATFGVNIYKERCHGFGYDYNTDDYKLVNIELRNNKNSCLVQVYSSKSKSWKGSQRIRYDFRGFEKSGVLFNGALYWLARTDKQHSKVIILSMDMCEERFREVQLPTNRNNFRNMRVLEGCLCVLAYNIQGAFEIWATKDPGVGESWTKLHTTIKFNSTLLRMDVYVKYVKFAGTLMNGEILFEDSVVDKLILYDPKCRTIRKLNIPGIDIRAAVNHIETLVSLNSIIA